MADSIQEVAQAARAYTAAFTHRAGLEHQLVQSEERQTVTHDRLRELLPAALAACPDADAWRRLLAQIEALPGGEMMITDLPLLLPQDGENPWPDQGVA